MDLSSDLLPQSARGGAVEEPEDPQSSSVSSFYSDGDEEDDSSSANSTGPPSEEGPVFEMSALLPLLPVKRGLSKHYDGKSQSFTSLANVGSLEDLAKPDRSFKKRLKLCKSYGGNLDCHIAHSPKSRAITKKASPMVNARRHSFAGHKPPIYPQRSNSALSGHTFLLA